jgi:hypothetical protein
MTPADLATFRSVASMATITPEDLPNPTPEQVRAKWDANTTSVTWWRPNQTLVVDLIEAVMLSRMHPSGVVNQRLDAIIRALPPMETPCCGKAN